MPTVPAANVAVVIESAGFTVIVNCFVAVCAVGVSASVTVTVNVVPTPVGEPEIVFPLSVSPAGRLPVVTCHV